MVTYLDDLIWKRKITPEHLADLMAPIPEATVRSWVVGWRTCVFVGMRLHERLGMVALTPGKGQPTSRCRAACSRAAGSDNRPLGRVVLFGLPGRHVGEDPDHVRRAGRTDPSEDGRGRPQMGARRLPLEVVADHVLMPFGQGVECGLGLNTPCACDVQPSRRSSNSRSFKASSRHWSARSSL